MYVQLVFQVIVFDFIFPHKVAIHYQTSLNLTFFFQLLILFFYLIVKALNSLPVSITSNFYS